jgi:hypothetical protein
LSLGTVEHEDAGAAAAGERDVSLAVAAAIAVAADCDTRGERQRTAGENDGLARQAGIESDLVGARIGIGECDRLAQGSGARVIGIGDDER